MIGNWAMIRVVNPWQTTLNFEKKLADFPGPFQAFPNLQSDNLQQQKQCFYLLKRE